MSVAVTFRVRVEPSVLDPSANRDYAIGIIGAAAELGSWGRAIPFLLERQSQSQPQRSAAADSGLSASFATLTASDSDLSMAASQSSLLSVASSAAAGGSVWSGSVTTQSGVPYRCVVFDRRTQSIVRWESLLPDARVITPGGEEVVFGQLPSTHRKRTGGGRSRFVDHSWLAPPQPAAAAAADTKVDPLFVSPSELRFTFGAYTGRPAVRLFADSAKAEFEYRLTCRVETPTASPAGVSVNSTLIRWTDPADPTSPAASSAPAAAAASNAQPLNPTDVVTFTVRANMPALLKSRPMAVIDVERRPLGAAPAAPAVDTKSDSKQKRKGGAAAAAAAAAAATAGGWVRVGASSIPLESLLLGDGRQWNPKSATELRSRATFTQPITGASAGAGASVVGDLYGDMLLVHAWDNAANDLSLAYRPYWSRKITAQNRATLARPANAPPTDDETKDKALVAAAATSAVRTLDMGHRGLGRSLRKLAGQRKPSITENTILSFSAAAHSGAEFIELDVMLTRDRVPLVFHDFHLGVYTTPPEEKTSEECAKAGLNKIPVPLRNLSLKQIRHSKVGWQVVKKPGPAYSERPRPVLGKLIRKHWRTLMSCRVKLHVAELYRALGTADGNRDKERELTNAFLTGEPTLQEVLEHCPVWLGLNIEIKYPLEPEVEYLGFTTAFEINSYLDKILDVVFRYAGARRIILTCFHPDIVAALRLKQARYPIGLIHCGGEPAYYWDRRVQSMESGIAYTIAEPCNAFVVNSTPLFHVDTKHKDERLVGLRYVTRSRQAYNPNYAACGYGTEHPFHRLCFMTWGDLNSLSSFVTEQRAWGLDAVIEDNCGDITRRRGKPKSLFAPQSHIDVSNISPATVPPAAVVPSAQPRAAAAPAPASGEPLRFRLELSENDTKLTATRSTTPPAASAGSGSSLNSSFWYAGAGLVAAALFVGSALYLKQRSTASASSPK